MSERGSDAMKTRSRLGKQGFCASFELFFDTGPVLPQPAFDLPFVVLDGPCRGFLPTPTRRFQKLANVIEMILHPKLLPANLGNALLRPKFAWIAVSLRSLHKLFEKLFVLDLRQLGLCSTLAFGLQRFLASPVVRLQPTVDDLDRDSILLSRFGNFLALPNKADDSNPALFQLLRIGDSFHSLRYRQVVSYLNSISGDQ